MYSKFKSILIAKIFRILSISFNIILREFLREFFCQKHLSRK